MKLDPSRVSAYGYHAVCCQGTEGMAEGVPRGWTVTSLKEISVSLPGEARLAARRADLGGRGAAGPAPCTSSTTHVFHES